MAAGYAEGTVKNQGRPATVLPPVLGETIIRFSDALNQHLQLQGVTLLAVYLFGSYVKGTAHDGSDIDIAIVVSSYPAGKDRFDFAVFLMGFAQRFDISIEPHPFLSGDFIDDNIFAMEVDSTGELVFGQKVPIKSSSISVAL